MKQWEILQGDCRDVMGLVLADNSVDLVVTDPPYGMNYRSGRRAERFDAIAGDETADLYAEVLPDIVRVMKPNSHAYIFCSWHQLDRFLIETRKHLTVKNLIVWNKNNHGSGDLKGAYAPKHELIIFAHKGRRELRKRIPDVIDFAKVPARAMVHPTEKPVGLLELLIRNSSVEGELVFDPFAGSGATAVACVNSGRRFTGVELDERYAAIAEARIAAEAARAMGKAA